MPRALGHAWAMRLAAFCSVVHRHPQIMMHSTKEPTRSPVACSQGHTPPPMADPRLPSPPAEVGKRRGHAVAHELNEVGPEVLVHLILPLPGLVGEAEVGRKQLLIQLHRPMRGVGWGGVCGQDATKRRAAAGRKWVTRIAGGHSGWSRQDLGMVACQPVLLHRCMLYGRQVYPRACCPPA